MEFAIIFLGFFYLCFDIVAIISCLHWIFSNYTRGAIEKDGGALRGDAELALNRSGKWMSISIGAQIILNTIMPVQ